MKPTSKPRTAHQDIRTEGAVTQANYVDRACAFIRFGGGEGAVIVSEEAGLRDRRPSTPEQWRSWMAYFARIGVPTVFTRKHGVATVPTAWPWEFDASASTDIPPAPPVRPARFGASPRYRAQPMYRPDVGREAGHERERFEESRPETPQETLDRLDAGGPIAPPLSSDARAKFGLAPLPKAAE